MSLAPSLRYTLHQPVVVTSDFLVKFPLFSTDDLQVYVEGVQISLFTVTATFVGGRSTDAEINLLTGVSGIDVEIYGARSPRRDSDYLGNSPKLAINLQNDTDQLTAVQQEQARDFATAFKVSPQSPLLSPMSGDAASRSGRVPAFNKDGTGLEIGPNIDEISNAQSYAQSALKGASRAEAAADRATEKDIASYNLLSANSATVNDAALSGLVAAPLAPFDLNGLVYRVSSVPTSPRFQNGGWEIAGTPNAGTPNTVFPAEKTLALRRQQVSRGEFQYEIGSQGAVSTRGRGEDISVVSVVHKGPGHYSAETRPHLFARGRDEAGFRDEGAIALPSSVSEAISCFALGCFGNAMFAGVRASGGASETDKIYYRRVAEKRFNQSITFSTTNGSATVSAQLAAGKHWDVRPGDHVRISDVGASINNVVINALANNDLGYPVVTHDPSTRTITFVATNFDIGFAAEASGSVTLTTPEVEFRETAWAPILTVETGTNYTLLHGLELFVSGSDLIGQSGVHGAGATGCEFLRFTGLFASAALSGTTYTLGSEASETLVEPLALRLSTGAQIVSARTQDSSSIAPMVGYASDGNPSNATMYPLAAAFDTSPVAIAVDEANNWLYFVVTGKRNAGESDPARVPVYVIQQQLSDFIANGFDGQYWQVATVHNASQNAISTSNGAGAHGAVVDDGALQIFLTTEKQNIAGDLDGSPRVHLLEVAVGANGIVGAEFAIQKADYAVPEAVFANLKSIKLDVAALEIDRQFLPVNSALVSADNYSSFPTMVKRGGRLIVAYHHGTNHGESGPGAVSANKTRAGIGALVIDGTLEEGGAVRLSAGTEIEITSAGSDESGVTFQVDGFLNGVPVTRTGAGPAGNATVQLTGKIDLITNVSVTNGSLTGSVSIGLNRLPSDIAVRISDDDGAKWSAAVAAADGRSLGLRRCYYPSLGGTSDGNLILLFHERDIESDAVSQKYTTSPDGMTWADDKDLVVSGDIPAGFFAFFGRIQRTPSGKLIACAYYDTGQYVLVSSDNGASWISTEIFTESSFTTSEITVVVLDENSWAAYLRMDNKAGTLVQVTTSDGGATWGAGVQVGVMPVSGGYKSHDVVVTSVAGTRYIVLVIMSRDASTTAELNPNTIIAKWGNAEDVFASPSTSFFSGEEVLVDGLTNQLRNGYPSLIFDTGSNEGLLAYHQETGEITSEVKVQRVNLAEVILGKEEAVSWTPHIQGSTGVAITAVTQASPCQITATGHGRTTGEVVTISSVVGMAELNDKTYTITVVDPNTFKLDGVNSDTFTAYVAGGIVGYQPPYSGATEAYYVRRGRMVRAWGTLQLSAFPLSDYETGNLSIGGLPFLAAPSGSTMYLPGAIRINEKNSLVLSPFLSAVDGSTLLSLKHLTPTGRSDIAATEISTAANLLMNFDLEIWVK